ncbi:DUF2520 domain-containing protein [Paucibacter sp. APW11]|uniref:DUF2520 domain-containing protein n=1 Tax=Roseateles aquae TaxID=3077235 RepID=A0ABU3P978_9BURK|nr:DUF2520 domain-containing protein [Paucibacter sp. APW11]MDT8998291.1 DUF2520 domain-containing protein [Paucibacter sp. APW11]
MKGDLDGWVMGFVGAGRLARVMAQAMHAAGVAPRAVASRSAASAEALATAVPTAELMTAQQLLDRADLVFVTTPDDAIASTVASLRWRAGQAVVHCSGATELTALSAAAEQGALTGGFHPLQIFSDPAAALRHLPGTTVAIEAADPLLRQGLHQLARRLQLRPFELPPGSRALYHGAAGFAASYLLTVLGEAVQVFKRLGLEEGQALQALLPLARGSLDAAANVSSTGGAGLAAALSGPLMRGDTAVVAAHLQAFDGLGEAHGQLYRQLALRQLVLAEAGGRLDAAQLARLRGLCDAAGTAEHGN